MITKLRVVMLLLVAWSSTDARAEKPNEFRARFDTVAEAGDDAEIDRIAAAWKAADPKDPQVYVSLANYYFRRARTGSIQVSTKPPEEGDLAITNPDTGEVVGSLGPLAVPIDPALGARAVAALTEATRRFPRRMDIWFGRAHIQQEMSDFEGQCATLSAAFAYAKRDPKKLQWIEGAPLEGDPERVLPEIAQGYLAHYYELETPEGDERFLHLASLIAAAFPRHAYPVNSIGLYYAAKEDWEQALPYFEKAHALDPQDLLIVMNLGVLHAKRHDVAKARPYLETVIGSPSADPQMREDARRRLAELE
jgi:tetratricopeptide (TPR) repeat protein